MEVFVKLVGGILLIVALAVVLAFPVKWLWNDVVVSILHLRAITAMEAWELMVLCSILFKSSSSNSSSK